MIDTLRKIMKNALMDEKTPRTKWVRNWPAQVVLGVNMIRWTKGSENSILVALGKVDADERFPQFNNLKNFLELLINDLMDIVDLVR
jgi:dynein heavy chain